MAQPQTVEQILTRSATPSWFEGRARSPHTGPLRIVRPVEEAPT